ncbi:serine hydrolase [uncultured Clostridium sp.]|uniref:serine hydrolase n=1 Tax=uncultured Clostridium sp. TaxID=59620 RepID=UPI0028F02755|nr:serine hydrolase [uncultured Clostridium sp.]
MNLKEKINNMIKESKGDIAVVIKNLNTGSSIMINEEEVFPSASTIKLLIISALMKEISNGLIRLEDKIVLLNKCKCGGDGILKELDEGNGFTIREIVTLMIILSDNTATNILIDLMGMDKINDMAKELNLENTQLRRKMMDSEAAKMGKENITTAKDMCHILELIYSGKVVDEECSEIILNILKRQQVGGRINLYLPEDIIIAHKTGYLDRLEHDVGIIYHPYSDYIICVLTKNVETNKEGREIIGKISLEVYNTIEQI